MDKITEIISCVFEIVIIFIYFGGVLDKKENANKWYFGYFIACVGVNFVRTSLFLPFRLNVLVTVIIALITAFLCFNGTSFKKLFFVIVYTVALMISEILTASMLSNFFKIEYDDGLTMRYLGMALSTAFLFVFCIFTIYIARKKYRHLPIKYNILMILCPIFSLYLLILLDSYIAKLPENNYILSFVAVMGLCYINVMIFDFFDYYEKGLQAQTLDIILRSSEKNYALLQENEKELHILRHDIQKYMSEMKELLNEGNQATARQYAEDINEIVIKDTSISRTGNLVLDTILNVENKKAVRLGIKYDVKLNVSESINIASVDLSRILYNVIDNAIEACEKVKEKYILVSVSADSGLLKIVVENTSQPVEINDNKIKSTKSDKKKHGFGIASIKSALKNNNGLISFDYNNGIFVCRIIMQNSTEQKNNVVCAK